MSNRLGGQQGTAYLGTNANQPPNWVFSDRDPNEYDINNVSLGDMWLNQTDESVFILVSLAGNADSKGSIATWASLANDGTGSLSTLTGNTGGAISGNANANITLVGDGVGISISGNSGTHTMTASLVGGGIAAQSFPTDSGTATPAAGVLTIKADTAIVNAGSTVSFSAAGSTITFNVTDSNDNTIIGKSSGNSTISGGDNVILGEASGVRLTSGDDNTIIGGTAGNFITTGSGNIIIGSGSGSGLTNGDFGNTLIGSSGFAGSEQLVVVTAGASGTSVLHNYPGVNASTTNGGNIFVGYDSGNFTLAGGAGDASNNAVGSSALSSLTTGARNESMGSSSLSKLTTGSNNIGIGHNAGFNSGGNTGLLTGAHNVLVGYTAGSAYTGAESSNIVIGTVTGTVSESNTLRFGAGTGTGTGQINKAFISGIVGITPTVNDGIPVFVNSLGQLGTVGSFGSTIIQTVTGNSGGAVSPSAGNLNIVGDGTTAVVVGNPGTNTLTISSLGGGGGDLTVITGDTGSATPALGTINVITDNASQGAGASVLFSGAADTLSFKVSDASGNTLIGSTAGNATLSGTNNTGMGVASLRDMTTASANVSLGTSSGNSLTTGSSNVLIGASAGDGLTTGGTNILIGSSAGSNYASSEASNILLNATGTAAESNVLRIGAGTGTGSGQIAKAFISGVRGVTPDTTNGIPLFIGSAGQLGTVGNGGTTMVQTVTGNSGGAVGPASGNLNIVGDGTTIQITGNPGTNTLTVVGLGGGGGDLSILTGDSGSATAAGGTINVITGNSAQEAGSSVFFEGSGNTLQLGVTDSNDNTIIGSGSGKASITGNSNTALGTDCAKALTSGSSNVLLGIQTGSLITTGNGNFLCGNASTATMLKGTTTAAGLYGFGANGSIFLHNYGGFASGNTFVGYGSAGNFNVGQQASSTNNTACGSNTLPSLTTGVNNVALGAVAGFAITSGSSNTLLGVAAGANYTAGESSNICIGRSTSGTASESNVIRIGAGNGTGTGQINKAFISGIRGITTSISNAIPVVIDSAGQLGTAGGSSVITTLTGNTGGAVSASGGNITIRGDGTSVNVAGSPGTNTLTISAVGGSSGVYFSTYLTNSTTYPKDTVFTPIYDTLTTNQGSGFNSATSIFTAPVTGLYYFSINLGLYANVSWGDIYINFISTDNSYVSTYGNYSGLRVNNATNKLQSVMSESIYLPMDAGDTVFPQVVIAGSIASTVSLLGIGTGPNVRVPSGVYNSFGGCLVR